MDQEFIEYERTTGTNNPNNLWDSYEVEKQQYESDVAAMKENESVVTGLVDCKKCHSSKRTFSYPSQRGSADEGMTWFHSCKSCQINWKE